MLQYLKYINMFSIPKTMDIEELSNMKFRYVILHFFTMTLLIYLPVMFRLAITTPYELCVRLNNTHAINMLTEYFNEKGLNFNTLQDTGEISQYLVDVNNILIQSGLYQQIFNFVLIVSFFLILAVNISYLFIISTGYNFTRNLTSNITFKNVIKISVFSSTLSTIISAILSIVFGVLHIFIFQVIQCFWILRFLKSYDKKEKEYVETL